MSLSKEWDAEKKKLESVKVNTKKLFDQKLGDALEAADKADDKFHKMGTDKPAAVTAAKKARKETAEKAAKICKSYEKSLGMLNQITASEKAAIDRARQFLFDTIKILNKRQAI
jgi:hypothetical protein